MGLFKFLIAKKKKGKYHLLSVEVQERIGKQITQFTKL